MPGGVNGVGGVAICPGMADGGMPIGGGTIPAGGGAPPIGAMPPGGGIPPMGGAPAGAGGGAAGGGGGIGATCGCGGGNCWFISAMVMASRPPPSGAAPCIGAPIGGICWG